MELDPALVSGYPVVVALPVQWGDQDAYQHVNNTVYFRWFESARIAYSARVGLGAMMKARRVGPILAAIACDFRRQVTFPDTVHVGSRIAKIGRTSLTMEHLLISESARDVAAEGRSTLVVYDYTSGRPVPVPDEIRRAIETLEVKAL